MSTEITPEETPAVETGTYVPTENTEGLYYKYRMQSPQDYRPSSEKHSVVVILGDSMTGEDWVVGIFPMIDEDMVLATEDNISKVSVKTEVNVVTARQLRQQLIGAGLMSLVKDAIAGIEDETEKAIIENYWEYSQEYELNHPVMQQFATVLGISEEETKAIFEAASKLA